MTENVVVVTGADPRSALDTLQALHEAGSLELRAAAVVRRDEHGKLSLDHEAGDAVSFADRHPRLGAVVTLLLGPLDTLLFGNQLVSLYGAAEQSPEELAIGHLARTVPPGRHRGSRGRRRRARSRSAVWSLAGATPGSPAPRPGG